jgi:hypothetical protein
VTDKYNAPEGLSIISFSQSRFNNMKPIVDHVINIKPVSAVIWVVHQRIVDQDEVEVKDERDMLARYLDERFGFIKPDVPILLLVTSSPDVPVELPTLARVASLMGLSGDSLAAALQNDIARVASSLAVESAGCDTMEITVTTEAGSTSLSVSREHDVAAAICEAMQLPADTHDVEISLGGILVTGDET